MKAKTLAIASLLMILIVLSPDFQTEVSAKNSSISADDVIQVYLPTLTNNVPATVDINGPIAFIRNDDIWKADPGGTNESQLTFIGGYSEPVWARQGERIGYIRQFSLSGKNAWEVGIFDSATKQSTVIVPAQLVGTLPGDYYRYSNPRWSPDGLSLFFLAWDGRVQGFFIHKVDTRTGIRDNNFFPFYTRSFDIAPHTGRILFTDFSNYIPAGYSLNLANPDGSQKTIIVPLEDGISFYSPRWSPDEKTIAVVANGGRYGTGSIARFDPAGTYLGIFPQQISPVYSAILDWSPDGYYLIYDSLESLHQLNILTAGSILFTNGTQPSWGSLVK